MSLHPPTSKCMYATTSNCLSGARILPLSDMILVHGTRYSCKPCFMQKMDGAATSAAKKAPPPTINNTPSPVHVNVSMSQGVVGSSIGESMKGGGAFGGGGEDDGSGNAGVVIGVDGQVLDSVVDGDAGKGVEQLRKELTLVRRALASERVAHKRTIDALARFCESTSRAMKELSMRADNFAKPFIPARELR